MVLTIATNQSENEKNGNTDLYGIILDGRPVNADYFALSYNRYSKPIDARYPPPS